MPFTRSVPWFPVGRFRDFKRVGAGGEKEGGEQQYTRQLAMGVPTWGRQNLGMRLEILCFLLANSKEAGEWPRVSILDMVGS